VMRLCDFIERTIMGVNGRYKECLRDTTAPRYK